VIWVLSAIACYQQLVFRYSGKWCTILAMRKRLMFAVLFSFVTVGQAYCQAYLADTPDGLTYTDPDVYSVYSVVINSMVKFRYQADAKIYIYDHTATGWSDICPTPNKKHEAMLALAVANYAKANTVERRLLPRFTLETPYELVQRVPQWVTGIYFSSIGFNRHKTVAVLSASAKGGGGTYVLTKKDGKWQLLEGWSDMGCAWAS
jgi:hypothetical protein